MNSIENTLEKRRNFLRYAESFARGGPNPPNGPVELYVEVNGGCNIGCVFCMQELDPDDPNHKGSMSFETFQRLEPLFGKAAVLNLFGFGEPLLNKRFPDMLRLAGRHGLFSQFFTNATLLDRKMAEACLETGVGRVFFSLNAVDRTAYDEIHLRSDYDRVLENIRGMAELKRQNDGLGPELAVNFVLFDGNRDQLEGVVRFAGEVGIRFVTVKPMTVHLEKTAPRRLEHDPERDAAYVDGVREAARESGVHVDLDAFLDSRAGRGRFDHYACYQPFRTFYVDCRGDVKPCCFGGKFSLGNVTETDPLEIWNGPAFGGLRRDMLDAAPREECADCRKNGLNAPDDRLILDWDRMTLAPRTPGTERSATEDGRLTELLYCHGEDLKRLLGGRIDLVLRRVTELEAETKKWETEIRGRERRLREKLADLESMEGYLNSRIELMKEEEAFFREKTMAVYDSFFFKTYRKLTGMLKRK